MNIVHPSIKHKNNNIRDRIILTGIGIPYTLLCLFISWQNYILAKVSFFVCLIIMVNELYYMLPAYLKPLSRWKAIILGMSIPTYILLQQYLHVLNNKIVLKGYPYIIIIVIFIIYSIRLLKHNISHLPEKIAGTFLILIYPGAIGSLYFKIPSLPYHPGAHLTLAIGVMFANDGFAYILGNLLKKLEKKLRRKNTPLIVVSPNKTIVGYISGFVVGVLFFIGYDMVMPNLFPGSFLQLIIIATSVNIAGMLGDLLESGIKRSTHHKDSGTLMLGMGGVLDTFDSLLFACATYYVLYNIMYI